MKYTDEDLVRYADGTLDAARTERLLQAAESDQELAESMAALDASRLPFKAAFAQTKLPPVPEALKSHIADLVSVSRAEPAPIIRSQQSSRWRTMAIAACVLFSFVGGYLASTLVERDFNGDSLVADGSFSQDDIAWVQRVADYQSLYVPNTVSMIEDGQQKAELLLASVSESTGLQTAIPDLSAQGYNFVRAQELGYAGEVLVQLVYLKDGKLPLALCYMPTQSSTGPASAFGQHSDLGVAYWKQSGQRFVIVADEPESTLRELHSQTKSTWL